jgi:protocatechuate 4,5-dioxygenase alpha chain
MNDPIPSIEDLDDIPGTTIFTLQRAQRGYPLNQFCMSLMSPSNRTEFKADERAYLARWSMSPAARDAVLRRDFNAMIAEGGNIYFLAKIFATDGRNFQWAAAQMTGVTPQAYVEMMHTGGRSLAGLRSKREGR